MKIIWAEDDPYELQTYVEEFELEGFQVMQATTADQAKQVIENNTDADAVIVDIGLPREDGSLFDPNQGTWPGLTVIRWIKKNYSGLTVIGLSHLPSDQLPEWFNKHKVVYLRKTDYSILDLVNKIKIIISKEDPRKHLKAFIVHGHDKAAKYELKNYLQNTLKLREPVILHEQPSLGRTIIEKFEQEAHSVDLVFVLLTPDDVIYDAPTTAANKWRARENVIFEMGYFLGYFFGKLQRRKGKVILLYKGPLVLPTDISGIVYIDISNGIESAGEGIRKEVELLIKQF